jgi:hypothetical protein
LHRLLRRKRVSAFGDEAEFVDALSKRRTMCDKRSSESG